MHAHSLHNGFVWGLGLRGERALSWVGKCTAEHPRQRTGEISFRLGPLNRLRPINNGELCHKFSQFSWEIKILIKDLINHLPTYS